jgi:hypothetical protein
MTGKVEESLNLPHAASHVRPREPFEWSVISMVSKMQLKHDQPEISAPAHPSFVEFDRIIQVAVPTES